MLWAIIRRTAKTPALGLRLGVSSDETGGLARASRPMTTTLSGSYEVGGTGHS